MDDTVGAGLVAVTGDIPLAGRKSELQRHRSRSSDRTRPERGVVLDQSDHPRRRRSVGRGECRQSGWGRADGTLVLRRSRDHRQPVTLATRFGPYPASPAQTGDPPASVEVRRASLLSAAARLGLEINATPMDLPIGPYRGGRSAYLKDSDGANPELMQLAARPGRMLLLRPGNPPEATLVGSSACAAWTRRR